MTGEEDSELLYHGHCDHCGSSDARGFYSDGHSYCFGGQCPKPFGRWQEEDPETINERKEARKVSSDLIALGEPAGWPSRSINETTAIKWGFTRSEMSGSTVRVFNYRNTNGRPIAQKVRFKGKDFKFIGDTKGAGLFGMHLWRDSGRKIIITEGEMDAMSVSQIQGHKWPVVSIPNGAQGAKKSLQKHIDWLERFEEVILMFDMDDDGQKAVEDCAPIFTPGKCKVAKLPLKDPNAMLMAGREAEVVDAIFGAKEYRPDGIIGISDIVEEAMKPVEWGIPWFSDTLTKLTYGRRWGELYGFGAGTGIGKTDFLMQQIAYDTQVLGLKVGAIFLEQKPVETAKRAAGKHAGKTFHIPDVEFDPQELRDALEGMSDKVYFYDNWGETEWDRVKGHIRFMAVSLGVRVFYIDHLTAMADTANEKESLEQIMKEMAMLANQLGVIIHFVSHLTTPDGTPHEEGGRVMSRHFKGSRSIGFWSFFMFGLERNPQDEDRDIATTTIFRVLKDRYTGRANGQTIFFGFNAEEGRLYEREDDPFNKENEDAPSFGEYAGDDEVPF